MQNLLDSNRLLNLKARHGVSIATTNTTSIYLSCKKLEKKLKQGLAEFFTYKMDLDIFVDKVLEKINEIEVCEAVEAYFDSQDPEIFIEKASKIKPFMIEMKKRASNNKAKEVKEKLTEELDDDIIVEKSEDPLFLLEEEEEI